MGAATAQCGPGEASDGAGEAAVGGKADGFEDHLHPACDMGFAVDGEGAARIGTPMAPAVVRLADRVGGVIGVGEFVVLRFGEAPEGYA